MPAGAIDAHAHIFTDRQSPAADAWYRPARAAPLEAFLACIERAGIARAVLSAASIFGADNSYALRATSRDPRLRTTVIVDPAADYSELAEMAAMGAVGVRFQWRSLAEPPDLSLPGYQRLLRHVGDLGWHVELHDRGERLRAPLRIIGEMGLPLVVDHFGRPSAEEGTLSEGFVALLDSVQRGRTWVKVSAAFRIGPEALVADLAASLLAHAGPERLVWGSDWPFVAYEDRVDYPFALAQFERLFPDPLVREAIHRTAGRLYFRDQA